MGPEKIAHGKRQAQADHDVEPIKVVSQMLPLLSHFHADIGQKITPGQRTEKGEEDEPLNVHTVDAGARYAVRIARLILKEGLPDETLVNLNIPNRPFRSIIGVRVTCLSRRRFDNPIIEKVDPHGRTYYWIAGTRVSWSRSKDADHEALEQGAVSLTPIHLDTTNHGALDRFRKWETVCRPNARQVAALSKLKGKQRS